MICEAIVSVSKAVTAVYGATEPSRGTNMNTTATASTPQNLALRERNHQGQNELIDGPAALVCKGRERRHQRHGRLLNFDARAG